MNTHSDIKLTNEQLQIIKYTLQPNDVISINAFAGTGKTSTLVQFAKSNLDMLFLYIAFNKSVEIEASNKFPTNVTCKTAHGLAFSKCGRTYYKKLDDLRENNVLEILHLNNLEEAKFTSETLQNYFHSADKIINDTHIPEIAKKRYNSDVIPDFVPMAEYLFKEMKKLTSDVPMSHDGYLKLYQLTNPLLHYDCIFLDEAQDISPVISDFVFSQNCPIILVGDRYQSIYSWRGAENVMQNLEFTKNFYLTQSFRFGHEIASLANSVLHIFHKEKKQLKGSDIPSIIGIVQGRHAIIARTNPSIFDFAVELYESYVLGFAGGIKNYNFGFLRDISYLRSQKKAKIKDIFVKSFDSYYDLREYAHTVEDSELISCCRIVDKYGNSIPSLIYKIGSRTVNELIHADIILSTAHKSKGLEFKNVLLADDFYHLTDKGNIIEVKKDNFEDINLIYVALTRAINTLQINNNLSLFLKVSEKFYQREKIRVTNESNIS